MKTSVCVCECVSVSGCSGPLQAGETLPALVLFSGVDGLSVFFYFSQVVKEPQNHRHCLMSPFFSSVR